MKKISTILAISVLFCSMIPSSRAIEYQSPRTLGLGGAGRAGPLLNDAIYLNPSFGSYNPIYSLSGGYTSFSGGRNYNVSIQDSRTEMFQAGAGYTKREQNSVVSLGASKSILKGLGIGVGSKLLLDNGTNKMTSDFLVSASYLASHWMYASIILDNLIADGNRTSRNLNRTLYTAFKFIPTKKVELFFDPLYSPSYSGGRKSGYSAGVELGLLSDFYLRMGKFQDAEITHLDTRGSGFGYGLGWIGPKLNLEYALSRALSTHSGGSQVDAHSGSMTVYF